MVIVKICIAAIVLFISIKAITYLEENIITESASARLDILFIVGLILIDICTLYILHNIFFGLWPLIQNILHK